MPLVEILELKMRKAYININMYTVEAYTMMICIRLGYLQRIVVVIIFSFFSWKGVLLLC